MKLLNFNIIKITACLIIGILIGLYCKIPFLHITIIYLLLFIGLFVYYLITKTKAYQSLLFGVLTFLTFICIGITATKIHDETNSETHYTHHKQNATGYQELTFKIIERLKPDKYNDKYFAEIVRLDAAEVTGKILVNVEKDSFSEPLKIGSVFLTHSELTEVTKPKNPFQFDYKKYLKHRNVHHQIYLRDNGFISVGVNVKSIMYYADRFRTKINKELKLAGFKDDVLSIINALLLGQRQDISAEIYTNYVNAGVIHILAVSGLHVGIIFLILTQLLKPLYRLKNGKHFLKPILIIVFLWSFAFVAGLSPSVTRAVTMFSIITCAQFLKRPTNIYNTLTISAFLMLLLKPIYLLDIGFQMSYLAVLAIVTIQPLLYKLWQPSNLFTNKIWQIFTVTIAAQLGVAPISLFYFHQFPGLFFISNLVIIPLLGLILGAGILVISLSLMGILPEIIVKIFSLIIESLNRFIGWIAQFENFLLKDISFNIYYVLSSYLIIISFIFLWKTKTHKSVIYFLFSLLLFSSAMVYNKYNTKNSEFVIFNKSRATLLGKKHNEKLHVYSSVIDSTLNNTIIKNYNTAYSTSETLTNPLKYVYTFKNNLILVIDSVGIYNAKQFKPDYILLSNSPKVNLNRLIDSLKPKQIIADASNYKSYVTRWRKTCGNKKIPFHSTYEKGAFIISE